MTKPEFVSVPRRFAETVLLCMRDLIATFGVGPEATCVEVANEMEAMLAAAPSPEPRAVEGKDWPCPKCGEYSVADHEQCPGCGRFGRASDVAPQSAPAPLTAEGRARLQELSDASTSRLSHDEECALDDALRICDHHRDSVGRKT
jgi:ribosomal protein S27AE